MELIMPLTVVGIILVFLIVLSVSNKVEIEKLKRTLEINTRYGFYSSRIERIERELNNLPQNRAKLALDKLEEVKQIMDELEE